MTDEIPQEWVDAACREFEMPLSGTVQERFAVALAAVFPLIEQRARLDERERLSSRVHENGWCPTCARDTDEAAMQRIAGKPVESLSRNDLIGLALRNLSAAMDAEARADAAEQRVIDRLAREAGSNPYTPAPAARHYDAQSDDVIRESAWDEGVACGVAAERAAWEVVVAQFPQPPAEDASDDEIEQWYADHGDWFQRLAALAPERTTGEGEAASAQPALPEPQ